MNEAMNPPPMKLTYERGQVLVARKLLVVILALTALNTLILAIYFARPVVTHVFDSVQAWRNAKAVIAPALIPATPSPASTALSPDSDELTDEQILTEQKNWLAFSQPVDRVVYEEDAAACAKLRLDSSYRPLACDNFHAPVAFAWTKPVIFEMKMSPIFDCDFSGAMVFMHQLVSPAGYVRLVHVSFTAAPMWDTRGNGVLVRMIPSLNARVLFPGTKYFAPAKRYSAVWTLEDRDYLNVNLLSDTPVCSYVGNESMRLFAGQTDPADPAAFVIPYQRGETKGFIRGSLKDDDTIEITGIKIIGTNSTGFGRTG